jgi:hypothetical protein
MSALSASKDFPSAYPEDVVKLITTMAIDAKNVVLGGSSAIRSISYPADYDAVDKTRKVLPKQFKEVIADLLTTKDCLIGDIKCGGVEKWEVISPNATVENGKVVGYNATDARNRLNALKGSIISKAEYDTASALLVNNPTPLQFLTARKEIKFHIIRWTPREVLKGATVLRDGSEYTLEEGVKDLRNMMKCDTVGFVSNNRFTDFSMIYKRSADMGDIENALQCDILYYEGVGEYFKTLKRMFALARYRKNMDFMRKVLPILNGDLGILYSLKSDCDTLLYLVENADIIPTEKIHYEIDQFRSRISHLYQIDAVATKGSTLLSEINRLDNLPSKRLATGIERFSNMLMGLLNKYTKEEMEKGGLMPSGDWLP